MEPEKYCSLLPADWSCSGELQAAQRPHHLRGVEPGRLERVRCLRSGRRHQPVGPVGGVERCGRQGGGAEGPSSSAPVPAPGPV